MATEYVITNTNSDLTSQGATHNKKALAAADGSGTSLDITLAGGASGSAAFYTEPSVPGLTSWPAGDYTLQFDVDATGADITYTISLRRVNSAGVLQQTLGTSGTLSGTGLKSHTVNVGSPISVNAGDRLVGVVSATRAASHGNQTLTISLNGTNDKLIGAWSVVVNTNITPDAGALAAAGIAPRTDLGIITTVGALAAAGLAPSLLEETPGHKIRRIVNAVVTDTAKTLTATDAYYESELFTATRAQLQAMEIGAVRVQMDANMQVEDIYLLVDFEEMPEATPPAGSLTLTGIAPRWDLGIIVPTEA